MLFTLLTDWRQAMKGDEQTRHSGTSHKAAENFYMIMKEKRQQRLRDIFVDYYRQTF